jgi:putative (di)nucleoside polyphosphate hydrolase
MDSESDYFRASVGALIVDRKGRIIVFKRSGGRSREWQLPQGGLLRGEKPTNAIFREIMEETSIPRSKLDLVDEMEEWLGYELPASYRTAKTERGQVQKWFLLRYSGQDSDIRPNGEEFDAWKWMTPAQLIGAAASFRRPIYRRVLDRFLARLTHS